MVHQGGRLRIPEKHVKRIGINKQLSSRRENDLSTDMVVPKFRKSRNEIAPGYNSPVRRHDLVVYLLKVAIPYPRGTKSCHHNVLAGNIKTKRNIQAGDSSQSASETVSSEENWSFLLTYENFQSPNEAMLD